MNLMKHNQVEKRRQSFGLNAELLDRALNEMEKENNEGVAGGGKNYSIGII